MTNQPSFKIEFLRSEKHFLMPTFKTIYLVQNLYDILFQYVVNPEREEMLKLFIAKLEKHIKSKPKAPFSIPYSELEFLEEGLQELRLLNWMELDVAVCKVIVDGDQDVLDKTLELLENFITFNRVDDTNTIYVYPSGLTKY
ncbi:MAG: hypothetical protein GX790_00630 [Syntrophomonadaceae bacterium]|nr:hypothetical protein [Syntrophomonadaceae bacterium]